MLQKGKIKRYIKHKIIEELSDGDKIIILYGARQTGKTTLSNEILSEIKLKVLRVNADELKFQDILSSRDLRKLKQLVDGYDLLFIDEAQRIKDIGINLKILKDNLPKLKILVTGSSSLELANKVKEPLTGRTSTFNLYPISILELNNYYNFIELKDRLEEFLVYGMYPDIYRRININKKKKYLLELSGSYLYKDVLDLSSIRNPSVLNDLLRLLSFQIGSEVSLNEIGNNLGINLETVNNYINLLEKAFIVFRLGGFSRNLRKEVSKRNKIYFWDLGIRNIIINNLNSIDKRNDVGVLWENFCISERLKVNNYKELYANSYFWRTYTGAEIDYIEEKDGELYAYEIKNKRPRLKAPKTWLENYSTNYKCITQDNFNEFLF